MIFRFDIPGKAAPKGSRVSGVTKTGVRYNREANPRVQLWMSHAKDVLREQAAEQRHVTFTKDMPLTLRVAFVVERPKKATYEYPPQGDTDKFVRAVGDALQAAGVVEDDAQIVRIEAEKLYGSVSCTRGYLTPR